jgi:hypothetical protein
VKARKVKKLEPDGPLADNLLRIVAVRLDEVRSFSEAAHDPGAVTALHDMRIASKRLRYVLELATPTFGPEAAKGAKHAKKLQDVLGEIHDCDEFVPRVEAHIARLRAEDAAAVRAAAPPRSKDLEPSAARRSPNRLLYRGLEALDAYLRARREVLYAQFLREWERLEADGLSPALVERLEGSTIGGA